MRANRTSSVVRSFVSPVATLISLIAPSHALPAQAASSTNWFLATGRVGPGITTQSPAWVLTGALGLGAPTVPAASTSYVLLGGFAATLDAPVQGRPWLTGVSPGQAGLLGGTALTLHGTELNLGGPLSLTIGGVPAAINGRTASAIQTVLPPQPQPGPRSVSLAGTFGTTMLPAGVGVLPMIEWKAPPQPNVPFELVYHGRFGDLFLVIVGFAPSPFPIPFAPLAYGLQIDPTVLLTSGVIGVGDPAGYAVLPLPALSGVHGWYFQAAALTVDPSYALGAFSNLLSIQ